MSGYLPEKRPLIMTKQSDEGQHQDDKGEPEIQIRVLKVSIRDKQDVVIEEESPEKREKTGDQKGDFGFSENVCNGGQ